MDDNKSERNTGKISVEFAVDINSKADLEKVDQALKKKGVKLLSVDIEGKTIHLDLPLASTETTDSEQKVSIQTLQAFVEEQTGFLTVVKGLGQLTSAVAELRPLDSAVGAVRKQQQIMGLVRLSQLDNNTCFLDGDLDGTAAVSNHGFDRLLAIHEYGNLENDNLDSIGSPMFEICKPTSPSRQSLSQTLKLQGTNESTPQISIRKILPNCDVSSLIGRSVALSEMQNKRIISAGVIARASTIKVNTKQVCSCSGKTLWQERLDIKMYDNHD